MNVFSKISRTAFVFGIAGLYFSSPALTEPLQEQYKTVLMQHPAVTYWLEQKNASDALSHAATSLPDPQIVIGLDNLPLDNFSLNDYLPTSKVIGFHQQLPNTQGRRSREAKMKQMSRLYQLQADYQFQTLYSQLQVHLFKLKENQALEAINRKKLSLYWSVEEDLKGQLEAGASVYGRLSEVDIARTDIDHTLNELRAKRIELESVLIRLIGKVPDYSIPLPINDSVIWEPEKTALYPIDIAQQQVHVAEYERSIAEAAFKPNYSVQALYKQRHSGDNFDGDDWLSIQASISIPLWSETNQKPKQDAAEFHIKSAQWQLDDAKREWQQRMSTLQAKRDTAKSNIELLEKKTFSLQQIVLAEKRNYESGHSGLESVLRTQIDQLSLKEKLIQEKSRHQVLSAQYISHFVPESDAQAFTQQESIHSIFTGDAHDIQ